jgi:hypothetical protein
MNHQALRLRFAIIPITRELISTLYSDTQANTCLSPFGKNPKALPTLSSIILVAAFTYSSQETSTLELHITKQSEFGRRGW